MSSLRVKNLICRECGKRVAKAPVHVCEFCFGPLEVEYDYEIIKKALTANALKSRSWNMWRYAELLPLDSAPQVGLETGGTPLVRASRLAKNLGLSELWIKNDGVCSPTLSFKDRVVSVALSKAIEFGMKTVGCASTGNLANSVAAQAARAGLEAYIFVPTHLEKIKILMTQVFGAHVVGIEGNYDEVNRLCSEISNVKGWGLANVNLRPFYAEGSKTLAFEVIEELGWQLPDHMILPMAGGSLITKMKKAFHELALLGLVKNASKTRLHGAQAAGCDPIIAAWRENADNIRPQKPNTIAKSLAIGNPADGFYALNAIRESKGAADSVTDEEIVSAMQLLAETEGIFTETAGGVTLGVLRKLLAKGLIKENESVVLAITGNGLKTSEYVAAKLREPFSIPPKLEAFLKAHEQERFA